MTINESENMEILMNPGLPNKTRPLVMIDHVESCFQSNDIGTTGWSEKDRQQICPKGSIHNPDAPMDSTEIIKPERNALGYWTNEDLAKQMKLKAIAHIQNSLS